MLASLPSRMGRRRCRADSASPGTYSTNCRHAATAEDGTPSPLKATLHIQLPQSDDVGAHQLHTCLLAGTVSRGTGACCMQPRRCAKMQIQTTHSKNCLEKEACTICTTAYVSRMQPGMSGMARTLQPDHAGGQAGQQGEAALSSGVLAANRPPATGDTSA